MSDMMGTALEVKLDGDGCWPDLQETGYSNGRIVGIAALPNATSGGNPTVTIRVELEDGRTVLAQTTLRLFNMAAAALRGRYGEP